jgi:protein SMG8
MIIDGFNYYSSNSLFAIPANQEFVFVYTGSIETRDVLAYMTRQLIKSCTVDSGTTSSKSIENLDSSINYDELEGLIF